MSTRRPGPCCRDSTKVYVPVAENGAFLNVARNSNPAFLVGSARFVSSYRVSRSALTAWLTVEPNTVPVKDAGPTARVTSSDALRPLSASSRTGITSLDKPAASVSSVRGVGAKKPSPAERRLIQPFQRTSAEIRGLTNVPYRLWKSARALAEMESQAAMLTSSCRNMPGVVYR